MNDVVDELDIARLVRERRAAKGLSQAELAERVGTNQQTIGKIEKGLIKHSRFFPALGAELNVSLSQSPQAATAGIPAGELIDETEGLPVHGASVAVGGALTLSKDPVDWVARPFSLARVRGAYGIIVPDDTMVPDFWLGNIALVHPHLPATPNTTCVFYCRPPDGGPTAILIRHLRRITPEAWHVTQWNAGKGESRDFQLKRSEWQECHVTVGRYSY